MSRRYIDFVPKEGRAGSISRATRPKPQIRMPERVEVEEEVMVRVLPTDGNGGDPGETGGNRTERITRMRSVVSGGVRVRDDEFGGNLKAQNGDGVKTRSVVSGDAAKMRTEQMRRLEMMKRRQMAQARAEQAKRRAMGATGGSTESARASSDQVLAARAGRSSGQASTMRADMSSEQDLKAQQLRRQQMRRAQAEQMRKVQEQHAQQLEQTRLRQAEEEAKRARAEEREAERELEYEEAAQKLEEQVKAAKKAPVRQKVTNILRKRQTAKEGKQVEGAKNSQTGVKQEQNNLPARLATMGVESELLNDPMERPISEFADLEVLAHEIEEVTRGGVIVEEETQFVAAEASFSLKQAPQLGVVEDFQPKFINTEVEKRPLSGVKTGYSEAVTGEVMDEKETTEVGEDRGAGYSVGSGVGKLAGVTATGAVVAAGGFGSANVAGKRKVRKAATRVARAGERATKTGVNTAGIGVRAAGTGVDATKTGLNAARIGTKTGGAGVRVKATGNVDTGVKFINQNKVAKRPLSRIAYEGGANLGVANPKKTIAAEKPVNDAKGGKKSGTLGMVLAIVATIILGAVVGTVAFLLLPK